VPQNRIVAPFNGNAREKKKKWEFFPKNTADIVLQTVTIVPILWKIRGRFALIFPIEFSEFGIEHPPSLMLIIDCQSVQKQGNTVFVGLLAVVVFVAGCLFATPQSLAQEHFMEVASCDSSRVIHNFPSLSFSLPEERRLLHFRREPYTFDMGVVMRGYHLNDARIQWAGHENTMGAEGILTPSLTINQRNGGQWSFHGEFFIQDTLNDNVYIGSTNNDDHIISDERRSYLGNFNQNPFEVSQLNIRYRDPLFEFRIGKFESPFGNYHTPLMSNSRWDAPFIRTESILWRDTGILFRFTPSVFDVCVAITNGCEGNDTNSMKAITGRLGLDFSHVKFGISGMYQDGIGSEEQKEYKRYAGVDGMVRFGNWVLSSEVIYDQYGLRRPGLIPERDIFWRRSIYYRQIHHHRTVSRNRLAPVTGWGGYIDLTYHHRPWFFSINYGEYHPEKLRNPDYPQHDIVNRRFLVKAGWDFTRHLQWYNAVLIETGDYTAQLGRSRRGYAYMSGVKMEF